MHRHITIKQARTWLTCLATRQARTSLRCLTTQQARTLLRHLTTEQANKHCSGILLLGNVEICSLAYCKKIECPCWFAQEDHHPAGCSYKTDQTSPKHASWSPMRANILTRASPPGLLRSWESLHLLCDWTAKPSMVCLPAACNCHAVHAVHAVRVVLGMLCCLRYLCA